MTSWQIPSFTRWGSKFPAGIGYEERYENSIAGFNAYQQITVFDERGMAFSVSTSPFSTQRNLWSVSANGALNYIFKNNSAAPVADPNKPVLSAELIDSKTGKPGGVAAIRYGNGMVQHVRLNQGHYQPVTLPSSYVDHLEKRAREIEIATSGVGERLQKAQQLEREYLFKYCGGKGAITGLDDATSTKICTWRDQFKEPYARAAANFRGQLESLKQQAATLAQQQQMQAQTVGQQQQVQAIERARQSREWATLANQTADWAAGMRNLSNQTLQQVQSNMSWSVAPIGQPRSSTTVYCRNLTDNLVHCRN